MKNYITTIEKFWQDKDILKENNNFEELKKLINELNYELESGKISVCEKKNGVWEVNHWVKKAILLSFKIFEMKIYDANSIKWYDKIPLKFGIEDEEKLKSSNVRIVPGAYIRYATYIGKNVVVMPSFINVGSYIGDRTLIDSGVTVGSCAYIGKNCHISSNVVIAGVLEPLQESPVIIEDNCFIGAGSQISEGVIIEEGAVIATGVSISSSTKIVDRNNGKIIYGKVPAYSVVVSGTLPSSAPNLPSIYCAVIIKQVDNKTRSKTSINELLRSS